jgi:competence protein ComEC
MLRVHFLNVGHEDCTIIAHPSGRLTMVDINTSMDFDKETRSELVQEEMRKAYSSGGGILAYASASPFADARIANDSVSKRAERELTDPIKFLKERYPGRSLFRFVVTHPDLDHMRGIGYAGRHGAPAQDV